MTPKYEIIRQTLLKQIETGALPPDSLLPDENALAAEYGVSLITVRRAMTELAKDGVIRRVRGKGSYVKKRAPEKKRPGEEKVIAFLLNHDNNAAVSITRIISGVQEVLSQRGYRLLVEWNVLSGPIERATIDRMIANRVEGFLIYPFNPDADTGSYARMEASGLPYVLLDRYPHDRFCAYVGSDNLAGGRAACRAFVTRGHRKLAVLGSLTFLSSEQERIAGFQQAALEAGEGVSVCLPDPARRDLLVKTLLNEEVTGLFCVSDRVAARAIQALAERGLRVPEDISVIGFDDCYFDPLVNLKFSSVRQDFRGIGCVGAQTLLEMIQAPSCIHTKRLLGVEMIARDSSLSSPPAEKA
ncbi:MAG: GntR family transcriptional regulator [Clostridia bacterium]|nr:GntR family transcriptional regulator [Clostridia bacterium]